MIYKHLKTGKLYGVLPHTIINATNAQDGQEMIIYVGESKEGELKIFVREKTEFLKKFKKVKKFKKGRKKYF